MEELNEKIGVYIKTNADGYITEVGSDIFIKSLAGWTKVDEGFGDKYAHAQSQYFDKPLIDENGAYNYKYENGALVERDKTDELAKIKTTIEYPQLVENKIRTKYSVSAELAILRQRETKPEEFAEYNAFCEACKAEAKAIVENTNRR